LLGTKFAVCSASVFKIFVIGPAPSLAHAGLAFAV
jgi:hypothetical protein